MIERTSFLTPERQEILFGNIFNVLYFVMPLVIIWLAFEFGGEILAVIRKAFSRIDDHDEDEYKYDDD